MAKKKTKKVKELSEQELMDNYKQEYLKKLIKQHGPAAAQLYFDRQEEAGMFNKGGMPKKKKVPAIAISVGMVEIPKGKGKAKMMKGGMAYGKQHMYAAGGSVKMNPGLKALQKEAPEVVAKMLKK
jgi:hypothetical protein